MVKKKKESQKKVWGEKTFLIFLTFILLLFTLIVLVFANGLPSVVTVKLNSTTVANRTNENLTVFYTTNDDENNTVNFDWRHNGISIALVNMPFNTGSGSTVFDFSGRNN